MNTTKVSAALNTLSLGLAELAEAFDNAPRSGLQDDIDRLEALRAHTMPHDVPEPTPFVDIPEEVFAAPAGSLAVCPKHHIPYTEGQYGPYCKSTTDDPAWGKQKGDKLWCRITPKNAAEWLRITAA